MVRSYDKKDQKLLVNLHAACVNDSGLVRVFGQSQRWYCRLLDRHYWPSCCFAFIAAYGSSQTLCVFSESHWLFFILMHITTMHQLRHCYIVRYFLTVKRMTRGWPYCSNYVRMERWYFLKRTRQIEYQHHAVTKGKPEDRIIGDLSGQHDDNFTPLNGSPHDKDQLHDSISQLWGSIKHPRWLCWSR